MIRISRIFFPALAFISFSLCALIITLWVRSYWGTDYLARYTVISIGQASGSMGQEDPHAITTQVHAIAFTRGSIRSSSEMTTVYPRGATMPSDLASRPPYWSRGRLGPGHMGWDYFDNDNAKWFNRLGFHVLETVHGASFYDIQEKLLAIPAWLPTLLFALPPILLIRRFVKHNRRRRANLCPQCGYDLRATPDQCPECGHIFA